MAVLFVRYCQFSISIYMITEYVKGKPYFSDVQTKIPQKKYLDGNIKTDVLIIGGGVDGALTAYYFGKAKIDTALIEKSRLGYMNTSCATALLEYQLDDHADALTKYLTKQDTVNIYNIGLKSLADIEDIIAELGNECAYAPRDTLLYTLGGGEKELAREYEFRKDNGFPVRYIRPGDNPFGFPITAGIYAPSGGAELNPYVFARQLFGSAAKNGVRLYEHTEATEIIKTAKGYKIITNYGIEIDCKKIICATGYNTRLFTSRKLCDKFISYTVTTNPLPGAAWHNRCLLQDNSDPYHYLRLSPDDRIIAGGCDTPFKNDTIDEKAADAKYAELFRYVQRLFPDCADSMRIDYGFCGAFSATGNNLAVIGESPDDSGIWYNLGYGANGIVYAVYGAQMLAGMHAGRRDKYAPYFSPSRAIV